MKVESHLIFLRFYLFTFRERVREGEKEGEKHQSICCFLEPPFGDLAHNLAVCSGQESNQQPFGL